MSTTHAPIGNVNRIASTNAPRAMPAGLPSPGLAH
jgi:hypothetical protein